MNRQSITILHWDSNKLKPNEKFTCQAKANSEIWWYLMPNPSSTQQKERIAQKGSQRGRDHDTHDNKPIALKFFGSACLCHVCRLRLPRGYIHNTVSGLNGLMESFCADSGNISSFEGTRLWNVMELWSLECCRSMERYKVKMIFRVCCWLKLTVKF